MYNNICMYIKFLFCVKMYFTAWGSTQDCNSAVSPGGSKYIALWEQAHAYACISLAMSVQRI